MSNNFGFVPQKFLDPDKTLFASGLSAGHALADLGAGSGFYVMAGAKIVGDQGSVYAVDIMESALDHIAAEARLKNLRNITILRANLEEEKSCSAIESGTLDYVLMANIVHQIKNKQELFKEAYRILKTGGKLVVIEWNQNPSPIGPGAAGRTPAEQILALAKEMSLKEAGTIPVDQYHYGLMFIK